VLAWRGLLSTLFEILSEGFGAIGSVSDLYALGS
jgi:hypothetical protein